MALNFGGAASFTAGGALIASLDANGVLSNPNRPYLLATQSGASGATETAVGADIIFNAVGTNTGNCYNSTNGRFTAPAAGVYHVLWRQLAQNTSAAGEYLFGVYINGVNWLSSYTGKQLTSTWNSNSHRTHVYLNAGDYITLRYIAGSGNTYTDADYAVYSVCLVQ